MLKDFAVILPTMGAILGVIAVIVIALKGYVKAPPNEAFIISGFKYRTIIGKSSIVIPIVERVDKLTLELITVDVKNKETPTNDFIMVDIDGVVQLQVDDTEEGMAKASKNFLNLTPDQISDKVKEVLEGNMREITGQMELKEMIQDRKAFGEKVQENATPDMAEMGLRIVAFNIQSYSDNSGIIYALGTENSEKIKMNSTIMKTNAERDIRKQKAEAENIARATELETEEEINKRENATAIKKAHLQLESEKEIAKAEKAKEIELAKQELFVEEEKLKMQSHIADKNIELKEKEYEADIKKKADAEEYRAKKEADAERYVRQQKAEAEKQERLLDAEASREEQRLAAISTKEIGLAEAEAISAKLKAEAEGIREKAEAMKEYGQAAQLEMIISVLPQIAENIAKPLEKIGNITMYGEGNVAKMTKDITNSTTQAMNGIFDATGIDLSSVLTGFLGAKALGSDFDIDDAIEVIKEDNIDKSSEDQATESFREETFDDINDMNNEEVEGEEE